VEAPGIENAISIHSEQFHVGEHAGPTLQTDSEADRPNTIDPSTIQAGVDHLDQLIESIMTAQSKALQSKNMKLVGILAGQLQALAEA